MSQQTPGASAPPPFRSTSPSGSPSVDPSRPHDTCFKCGKPTPLGVSLCDDDNPAKIGSPSTTQAHGTIFMSVLAGIVGFLLIANLSVRGVGPFPAFVAGGTTEADGTIQLVVEVTNEGERDSRATCRITRGGIAGPDDLTFMTDPIAVGETADFSRELRPPTSAPPYQIDRLTVRCS